jgi:excisionase family DNA binding protein
MNETRIYTLQDLSERWGASMSVLYDMVRNRELKAFKVGKNYRVTEAEVRRIEGGDACAERHTKTR